MKNHYKILWYSLIYLSKNGHLLYRTRCQYLSKLWHSCVDYLSLHPCRTGLYILKIHSPTQECMKQISESAESAQPFFLVRININFPTLVWKTTSQLIIAGRWLLLEWVHWKEEWRNMLLLDKPVLVCCDIFRAHTLGKSESILWTCMCVCVCLFVNMRMYSYACAILRSSAT